MSFIVAIDGPSGAGKGTITSALAKKFNLMYLDTGATYRCVTLKFLKEKIIKVEGTDFDKIDIEKVKKALKEINIEFKEDGKVFLDGEDVTKEIREPDVAKNVSQVSHIIEVRLAMVDLQRKMSKGKDVILEGRDIGTNVFPNADVKIYLDASLEERVRRRIKQNKEKGIEMSEQEVHDNMAKRDEQDRTAEIAPLTQAEDAIYVDTSKMSIKKVIKTLSKMIKKGRKYYDRMESAYVVTKDTKLKSFRRAVIKKICAFGYRCMFRVKMINKQAVNQNKDEGLIICANHMNYFDACGIVWLNKRYISFVGKIQLWKSGLLNHLAHIFNLIPVRRETTDIRSVKMILKALKENKAVGIFPEGTRNGMAKNSDIKDGAVYLAYKAGVKILPVGVSGSFKPFSKVTFNYGEPIDITKFKTDDPDWMDKATEEVMKQIVKLTKITK